MNSNFIQDYFKLDQSTATNKDLNLSANNKQEVSNQAADNLLFSDLTDQKQDVTVIGIRKRVKSDHDQHVTFERNQFSNNDQVVNECDIKSTLSSEDEVSVNYGSSESVDLFEGLDRILSERVTGKVLHSRQRIVVESIFNGLLGEQTHLFKVPCFIAQDNSCFIVYLSESDMVKFNKTLLFNLVDTAEKSSNRCKKIVFVVSKKNMEQINRTEKLFSVIDATQLKVEEMKALCKPEEFIMTQRDYGMYELQL